jgi:hypothetical protein
MTICECSTMLDLHHILRYTHGRTSANLAQGSDKDSDQSARPMKSKSGCGWMAGHTWKTALRGKHIHPSRFLDSTLSISWANVLRCNVARFIDKLFLYGNSIGKFKDQNSPYLYPMYGLGDLPQAFARLCAVWGGVYMLNTPVDKVLVEGGKAVGIESGGNKAFAPIIIADPSYFAEIPGKARVVGKIARAICLQNHPPGVP